MQCFLGGCSTSVRPLAPAVVYVGAQCCSHIPGPAELTGAELQGACLANLSTVVYDGCPVHHVEAFAVGSCVRQQRDGFFSTYDSKHVCVSVRLLCIAVCSCGAVGGFPIAWLGLYWHAQRLLIHAACSACIRLLVIAELCCRLRHCLFCSAGQHVPSPQATLGNV